MPAWCDRILWRKHPKTKQMILTSIEGINFSDHRPVFAQFEIQTDKIIEQKTNDLEQQYYERMRFQSVYALGGKVSSTPQRLDENHLEVQAES